MATVSHLLVLVEGDATSLKSALAQSTAATKGFETATTSASRSSASAFARIKTSASTSLGAAVPLGAGLAGAAVLKFASDTVSAASDQEEALNKVRVVFGDTAGSVEEFAQSAATNLGLSETAALSAAGTFGTLLNSAGLAKDEIADFSIELVTLAGDLASFNNIDVDDALLKLRSGLSGEAEPLRSLGVFLNEAKVEAEAFSSGIARVGTELTDAQKIQARYNIILEETALAQGDFERTSDSLANQQRTLAAEFQNMQAEIGQELLPVVKELTDVAGDLVPVIGTLLKAAIEVAVDAARPFVDTLKLAVDLLDALGLAGDDAAASTGGVADATAEAASMWGKFLESSNPLSWMLKYSFAAKDWIFGTNEMTSAAVDLTGAYAGTREAGAGLADGTDHLIGKITSLEHAQNEATREAYKHAAALNEQLDAQLALAGGVLGFVNSAKDLQEAQAELNKLERQGKEDTKAYEQAALDAIEAQLGLESATLDLADEIIAGNTSFEDAKGTLKDWAKEAGVSREVFKRLLEPLRNARDELDYLNGLPRVFEYDVVLTYNTVGTIPGGLRSGNAAGGISGNAAGGIVRAAHGMITQGPTILAGEGTYSTFAGRGAEAIIPLNERGINILGEALKTALEMFGVRRAVTGETTAKEMVGLLKNIRDDFRRSGILDLSQIVSVIRDATTKKEAQDFQHAFRDAFRESAGRVVFGEPFRQVRSMLADISGKTYADTVLNDLKKEWRRTGMFDYEKLRKALRAGDVPNSEIRDTLVDIHDQIRNQVTDRAMRDQEDRFRKHRGQDGTIQITMDRRHPAEELAREDRYRGWR